METAEIVTAMTELQQKPNNPSGSNTVKGEKRRFHSTFAHTYANRWNAVMCPKIPKSSSSQPNQPSQ